MRIGMVAKRVGASPSWLRKLERHGKIARAARDRNGHRRYTPEDVERIYQVIYPSGDEPDATSTPTSAPHPAAELVEVALGRQHSINAIPYGPGIVRVPAGLAAVLREGEWRAVEGLRRERSNR